MITFRIIDHHEVGHAYAWHIEFASADHAIFPRGEEEFGNLALDRCLWGAFNPDGRLLGLSYIKIETNRKSIEVGGLMVSASARGKGIGGVLMRLPIAHLLVNEQPLDWKTQPTILTHVLKDNENPLGVIRDCGFICAKDVKIPADQLPGLRASEDGFVHGLEFHFDIPSALVSLATWLKDWSGTLRDDDPCAVDLREGDSLDIWGDIILSIAKKKTEVQENAA